MTNENEPIAIVYICTGEYVVFWHDFYESFEKYFLPGHKKAYFVFTDAADIYDSDKDNVNLIYQENLEWPGNTLFRYRIFLTQRKNLIKYDYVFFMNANVQCVDTIGEEFLPDKENMLFVRHPGYYNVPNFLFPYDRNKKSTAYIPYFKGDAYICGGINGGRSEYFIRMCEDINRATDEDYDRGIIARWHDESQINKFLLSQDTFKILNPGYCYPEGENLPYKPYLIVRDKSNYLDIKTVKGNARKKSKLETILRIIFKKRKGIPV